MLLTWLCLLGAIVFEVAGTTCMKLAQGSARPGNAWASWAWTSRPSRCSPWPSSAWT